MAERIRLTGEAAKAAKISVRATKANLARYAKHGKKKARKPKPDINWDGVDVNAPAKADPIYSKPYIPALDPDPEEEPVYEIPQKKRGKPPTKITISQMADAIKRCDGYVTRAAMYLAMPLVTLQTYIKKNNRLREVLFETRSVHVDTAEESLRSLVQAKNLTATIFTLKCLGQDRGYIDSPRVDKSSNAPIIIKLIPADSSVKMPKLPALKALTMGRGKPLRVPDQLKDEDEDIIDAEVLDG